MNKVNRYIDERKESPVEETKKDPNEKAGQPVKETKQGNENAGQPAEETKKDSENAGQPAEEMKKDSENSGQPAETAGKNPKSSGRLVTFGRLVFESIPEMYGFQLLTGILLALLSFFLGWLVNLVAEAGGSAFTTSNIRDYVLSWRGPVLLVLGIIMVAVFVIFEIFANIYMCDDIICGRQVKIRGEIGKGFRAMKKFINPGGIGILVYILIAVPLVGIGFSISLTSQFRIPNFIMDFIRARPLLYAGYIAALILLLIIGIRWLFCLHAVLVDGMKPAEAKKTSVKIMKEHWKEFLPLMLGIIVLIFLINLAFGLLLKIPELHLEAAGSSLPRHYYVDFKSFINKTATDLDYDMAVYRFISTFVVIAGSFLMYILAMISTSYLLLRFTRCYYEYTREPSELWPERVKRSRYFTKVLVVIGSLVGLLILSFFIGLKFNQVVSRDEPVKVIAHRAGGVMAPENSLEGLELAISHSCYGSETDAQRTSDGYYIINHDNDFSRLCGVKKKPGELTLEETRKLTITDPATGKTAPVPTVEEMLDMVKGRIKLFLELKGESADRQMADDLVKLIREKDCIGDVALISLDASVIEYVESTYPEFETGILLFAGIGDISRLNCDLLIMEEDMGTEDRIALIHDSGKQAIVWTVNTEDSMHKFLDSSCDAVITDQVELAEKVQAELDQRSDFQIIRDKFSNLFDD